MNPITTFKPNPGLNPAALPEWRKLTKAVNDLERHRTILTGKIAGQSRSTGAVLGRISTAVAEVTTGGGDTRAGNAPTSLGAVATGYFDGVTGNPSTQVVLTWTAPATYTDGDPYTASGYEIWRQLTGGEWQFITEVSGTSATLMRQPFAGSTYQYEVRAQSADNGLLSAFSAPVTVTPPTTLAAFAAPGAPTLATSFGYVTATWDGQIAGATPPAGFRGVYAETATSSSGPWTAGGQNLLTAGATALGPFGAGTVVYVRLRAVDALGQAGTAGSSASITVIGLDSASSTALTTAQTTANTALTTANGKNQITRSTAAASGSGVTTGDMWWQVDGTGAVIASWSWQGGAWVSQTLSSTFIPNLDAGKITTGTLSASLIGANTITSAMIQAGQITSSLISTTGLTGITITGSTIQTLATASRGIKLSGTTLQAFDGSGNATLTVDGSTGAVTAVGLNATTATISGAITATSGSITGTMSVTGTLRAGTAGAARVDLTSAGLAGYNASNVQTFSFLTSSGALSATGGTFTGVTVSGAITATSGSISGALTIGSSGYIQSTFSQGTSPTSTQTMTLDGKGGLAVTSFTTAFTSGGTSFPATNYRTYMDGQSVTVADGTTTTQTPQIIMSSNGNQTGGTITSSGSSPYTNSLRLQGGVNADLLLGDDGNATAGSNPFLRSTAIYNRTYSGAAADTTVGGSTTGIVVCTSAGTLGILKGFLQDPDGYSRVVTTRAVNMSNFGTFGTAASSRRVKKNIKPLEWDNATVKRWLDIKPVEFEYKDGVHADGDVGVQHGFVAEDAHDAGFKRMVYYDDRPGTKTKGRVDGFAYERMGVYDHLVLGHLYDELMSLRQRVAVLEGA